MAILKELLESVRSGEKSFQPASVSAEDMEAFQPIAKAFEFAKREGYLDVCVIHRESETGNNWYDLVVVPNGLSYKGENFLLQPSPTVEQHLEGTSRMTERAIRAIILAGPHALRLDDELRLDPAVAYRRTVDHEHDAWGLLREDDANCVFVDPFALGLELTADFIFRVRRELPDVVFVLCASQTKISSTPHFYEGERSRFQHYYMVDTDTTLAEFHRIVSKVIERCKRTIGRRYEYDVALSFAGEQRTLAEGLAAHLKQSDVSYFYDAEQQADLWGRNLYDYLTDVYSRKARYCVLFASRAYAERMWTTLERQSAQERAIRQKGVEYILPIRCDDAVVPGLNQNVAYLPISMGVEAIAKILVQKLLRAR